MRSLHRSLIGSSLLVLLAACGGGGGGTNNPPPPPPKTIADTLVYTDPSSGTFRLVKNGTLSTSTHLVLDLVGPTATNGRGVAFTLNADTSKVTWAKVATTDAGLVQNVAFNLGTGSQIFSAKASGDTLSAGLFQKGAGPSAPPAVSLSAPLVRVALDLRAGIVPVNTTVSLVFGTSNKANYLPETGAPQTAALSVGTLVAQ